MSFLTVRLCLPPLRLLSFGSLLMLSGCYVDTSSMNTDTFVQQTRPVFYVKEEQPEQSPADDPNGTAYVAPQTPVGRVLGIGGKVLGNAFPNAPGKVETAALTSPPAQATAYDPAYADMYAAYMDKDRQIPAIPYKGINPKYLRQEVTFASEEKPGTIVVDTQDKLLYLILGNGKAMRYGVGIGRKGFAWSGRGVIQWRQRWPRWTPPDEMVVRQPEIAQYSAANGGMDPGLDNPLGARALYIFQNGQDSLFRIHGTPEWKSIGKAVSSGCVRMLNQDVIDLYDRLPEKAEIVVL